MADWKGYKYDFLENPKVPPSKMKKRKRSNRFTRRIYAYVSGKKYKYIGQTKKFIYERDKEHRRENKKKKYTSIDFYLHHETGKDATIKLLIEQDFKREDEADKWANFMEFVYMFAYETYRLEFNIKKPDHTSDSLKEAEARLEAFQILSKVKEVEIKEDPKVAYLDLLERAVANYKK
jgi:hypothetical protein